MPEICIKLVDAMIEKGEIPQEYREFSIFELDRIMRDQISKLMRSHAEIVAEVLN